MIEKPKISLNISKEGFRSIVGPLLIILVFSLSILPVIAAFNDSLTRFAINLKGYRIISNYIVPIEIRWVVVILRFLGVEASSASPYILLGQPGKDLLVELIWNCLGWQSLIVFIVTSFIGLSKTFTLISRSRALILGLLGTILVNILRITVIILLMSFLSHEVALVFHDYGALITNTAWLFFFWWFSYKFILEKR